MAAPRLCTAHLVLLIGFLCCISLSHGRIIPKEVRALKSSFNGVTVSDCSSPTTSEAQNFSPGRGKIVSSIGDADSGWQAKGRSISIVPDTPHVVLPSSLSISLSDLSSISASQAIVFTGASLHHNNHIAFRIAFRGKTWKRTLGKVAEWVLHTCAVLLAVFVVLYTVSCICACCIGLDLLAEIWRTLGGCGALRALLSYFVSAEQALVEGDAGSSPLLAGSAQ